MRCCLPPIPLAQAIFRHIPQTRPRYLYRSILQTTWCLVIKCFIKVRVIIQVMLVKLQRIFFEHEENL